MYLDPGMRSVKGKLLGEFKDARWHVRYLIDTTGRVTSTAWFDDLRHPGVEYTLYGTAAPR